jgi:hypothetical protein
MFLQKVYRVSPMMAVLFGSFALLTVVANVVKYQATPLFLWGMFSANAAINEEYLVYQYVTTAGDTLNYTDFATANPARTMLLGSADLAHTIAADSTKTHPIVRAFLPKLRQRLSTANFAKIENLLVRTITKNDANLANLKADSLWRNDFILHHFNKQIKSVCVVKYKYE